MRPTSLHSLYTRRSFLRTAGAGAAGLILVDSILADPYAPVRHLVRDAVPLRVRGAVRLNGKALAGVRVSDGLSVVATGPDGSYELHTHDRQEFLSCTVPGNARLPQNPTGTAKMYMPIIASGTGEIEASWDLEKEDRDLSRHGFLVLADPQTLDMEDIARFHAETVPDIRETIRRSDTPLFAVGCGDLMFDKLQYLPEYEKAISMIGIPGVQVLGNHDVDGAALSDGPSARTFKRFFGPTYYSFDRGEVHYVVLDDVLWFGRGYIGYIDDVQLEWLRQDLSFVEKGRRVVVFMHIPAYCTQHERFGQTKPSNAEVVTNRQALYAVLEGYDAHIVSGHMHESEHLMDGGASHHVCGAVCGAWWTGDICGDGTPNGYAVYAVSGSSFTECYKATGRGLDYQLRMYRPGSSADAPDDVIVNVWDAADGWNVNLVEDGIRIKMMPAGPMKDPLAAALLDGDGRPAKHKWADAYLTNHIFRARPNSSAATLRAEVVGPEGRTFLLDTFTFF